MSVIVVNFFALMCWGVTPSSRVHADEFKSRFAAEFFNEGGKKIDYVLWGFPEGFEPSFKEQDKEGFFGEQLSIYDFDRADMLFFSLEAWRDALLLPLLLLDFKAVFDHAAEESERQNLSVDIVVEREERQSPMRVYFINTTISGNAVASTWCFAETVYVTSTTDEVFENRDRTICTP
ncbi:hypothetical protein NNA36_18830 [Shimia sp. CNT1-13L.2]|uniref:hypothetical protein n=1 Tax=Shimia sp. CNT1-13L.2 TaxID=2959663 RepID=UPI0020CC1BD6|nr:hypothetical protein [Shimia sp. CNT1-13L.2]MCP9484021.1 hypothetical protein [Shimia sp. CNT1-13L.2]